MFHRLVPLALVLAACSPATTVALTNPSPRPLMPRTSIGMQMFWSNRPTAPFVEVAMIQSQQTNVYGAGMPRMVAEIRDQAASLGCDAIILSAAPIGSLSAFVGSCIIYTDAAAVASAAAPAMAAPSVPALVPAAPSDPAAPAAAELVIIPNPPTASIAAPAPATASAPVPAPAPAKTPTASVIAAKKPASAPARSAPAAAPSFDNPETARRARVAFALFDRLDADRDGVVSFAQVPADLGGKLERFDRNGDGFLTRGEVGQTFQREDAAAAGHTHAWGH